MTAAPFKPFKASEDPQAWWRSTVLAWLEWSGLTFTQFSRACGIPVHVLESWRSKGCIPRDVSRVGALMEKWSGVDTLTESLERAQRAAKTLKVERTLAQVRKPQKYMTRRKP